MVVHFNQQASNLYGKLKCLRFKLPMTYTGSRHLICRIILKELNCELTPSASDSIWLNLELPARMSRWSGIKTDDLVAKDVTGRNGNNEQMLQNHQNPKSAIWVVLPFWGNNNDCEKRRHPAFGKHVSFFLFFIFPFQNFQKRHTFKTRKAIFTIIPPAIALRLNGEPDFP